MQPDGQPLTQAQHVQRGAAFLAHRCRHDNTMVQAAMHALANESNWPEACNTFLLTADELLRRLSVATGRPVDELAQEVACQAALVNTTP